MAEPLTYSGSPFDDYLRDLDTPETSLSDPTPPSTSSLYVEPQSASSSSKLERVQPTPNSERLKYTLATSALLSTTIQDALELYPSLEALLERGREESCGNGNRNRKGKGKQIVRWPEEWDTIGHEWDDRSTLEKSRIALKGIVRIVKGLSRGRNPIEAAKPIVQIVRGREGSVVEDKDSGQNGMLKSVEEFVRCAQELDWRIADVLESLQAQTNIAPQMLYSLSTPPSTPPRTRTPSSSSPPRTSQSSQELLNSISTLITLFESATSQLVPFLSQPPESTPLPPQTLSKPTSLPRLRSKTHQPTASLSELYRHAQIALQEREEIEQFDQLTSPTLPLHPSPSTQSQAQEDPFHPTMTYFGGLERKSSTRSTSSNPTTERLSSSVGPGGGGGRSHRLRPSVGAVGAFGVTGSPLLREVGARRRRPKSMGGWIEHSSSPLLNSPLLKAVNVEEEVELGEKEGEKWEVYHKVRKGFVWSLITVFEESEESNQVGKIVEQVTKGLKRITKEVEGIQLMGNHILRKKSSSKRVVARPSSLYVPSPRPNQRSSHSPSSSSSIVITPNSPTPPSFQTPSSHIHHALSRLNGQRSSASIQPNFAPPLSLDSPQTLALQTYESQHSTLSHCLESLQSELKQVLSESRLLSPSLPLSTPESTARLEALLKLHDGIKDSLQLLAIEWAASRITLRQALGVELKQSRSEEEETVGLGIQEEEEEEGREEYQPPSPPITDPNASLDDGTSPQDLELDLSSRQALLDAALSLSLSPSQAEDEKEKVFEAVVGERSRSLGLGVGEKLSREERIRRMREAREALDVGKKAAGRGGGEEEGGMRMQLKMVGELREVLKGLGKGLEE